MNQTRIFLTIIIALVAVSVSAQTPRGGAARTPAPRPTPTPTATPKPDPPAAPLVTDQTAAVVNDTTISTGDIDDQVKTVIMTDPDQYLRDYFVDPVKAIREARQRALDARISSLLIAAEAKKRGKSSDEIIETEINSRIPAPTDQEIKAAYDANRAQLGSANLEEVRTELVNYIRGEASQKLYESLVNRLKMSYVINRNADVNAPNVAPGTVLAAVNGEPIRVDTINERIRSYEYKMQMRIFSVRKQVLDRRINDLLIVAEANKRKIGPEEIVRAEITDKIAAPSDADVTKFYEENKARIRGGLADARTAIVTYLQQQQQEKLETALAEKLRASAKLQILLKEPEPPTLKISLANGASRGDPNAAVTIVEFTDFQCSACGAMYPVVEEVLKTYGNRVHFVIRNFPLTRAHPNAFNAAQAAEAAKIQGKFWEYIDLLFHNQDKLEVETLKKFATQVGLDRKQFDAELDSGKYQAVIRKDIEDGETYGVEGTPTFYINGVVLTEYSADGLRAAIEKAFARAGRK
jgi:protein-disulfide isomerase